MSLTVDVEAQQAPFASPQAPAPQQAPHLDLQRVRSDIERRLRQVCAGMPADEFQALVEQMATVQMKYARLDQQ